MQNNLQLALNIATKAHEGQLDKAGDPYIKHPIYVASLVNTETEKIVALLHDVVEDTNVTLNDIKKYGFGEPITEALTLLTHNKNIPYFEYINKIKNNSVAKNVKIADLTHNSDISRINKPTKKDLERTVKYKKALEILTN